MFMSYLGVIVMSTWIKICLLKSPTFEWFLFLFFYLFLVTSEKCILQLNYKSKFFLNKFSNEDLRKIYVLRKKKKNRLFN